MNYKGKETNIKENDRASIVSAIKGVDKVIITNTLDKTSIWKELGFNAIFIGDDWKGNARWKNTEIELSKYGVDVIYSPHTEGISTTIINKKIKENKIQ